MNASWIARCFPEDAAGSGTEADGCCHATEHPSAPVILQERLIAWCCSFLLMVWAVGPACGPGMLSLLGHCPCWGGELGARTAASQLLCGSAAGKWFWRLSTRNLTALWGEVSRLAPLDAYPSLPLLSPPNSYSGSHSRGDVQGLEQPGEESRGENVGQLSLAELQLCHPEMETALVTSGNDIPSAHPAPGLSRTKGLLWSKGTGLGQS